jgi:hypothetical protein
VRCFPQCYGHRCHRCGCGVGFCSTVTNRDLYRGVWVCCGFPLPTPCLLLFVSCWRFQECTAALRSTVGSDHGESTRVEHLRTQAPPTLPKFKTEPHQNPEHFPPQLAHLLASFHAIARSPLLPINLVTSRQHLAAAGVDSILEPRIGKRTLSLAPPP